MGHKIISTQDYNVIFYDFRKPSGQGQETARHKLQLDSCMKLFKQEDYITAGLKFKSYLKKNPDDISATQYYFISLALSIFCDEREIQKTQAQIFTQIKKMSLPKIIEMITLISNYGEQHNNAALLNFSAGLSRFIGLLPVSQASITTFPKRPNLRILPF